MAAGLDSATAGNNLLKQVTTMMAFLHINEEITFDTIALEEYCAPDLHANPSIGTWQLTLIFAAVAVLCQVNSMLLVTNDSSGVVRNVSPSP